jgi:hypothetical protein
MEFRKTYTRLTTKVGQLTHQNRIGYPYLSGDFFASKSDLVLNRLNFENADFVKEISNADVLFCNGNDLALFADMHGQRLKNKILIVGNSDLDWLELPSGISLNIGGVFLQNSFIADSRVHTLPIGVENISYFRNGRSRNFSQKIIHTEKANKILVGPFSATHPVRAQILKTVQESEKVHISSREMEPFQYAKYSARFGYVASPRGNGEDTHRVWESLYRGSSPIVLNNQWSRSLKELNLPITFISNWDQEELDSVSDFQDFDPANLEPLWWEYWENKIKKLL